MDDSQIVLFADFDSGNLARYEKVYKSSNNNNNNQIGVTNSTSTSTVNNINNQSNNRSTNLTNDKQTDNADNNEKPVIQQRFDVEYNVWTKPDCEGTLVGPNGNRTWFYFGVKGGHGKFIKFNLMNLNRQGRLFEMGMLPVFRTLPGHEKWSRIYSKPTWQNLENNFLMSFIHRLPDKRDSITYFAFCFPHSYDECQAMLEKYDKQFEYCQNLTPDKCEQDTIYYHRELFCYSLDKRRIDLITISACNDIDLRREPRFDPEYLFPKVHSPTEGDYIVKNNKRCYRFDQKRVYVLTSRVHPGETPGSFVFNGFLEFILRKDDPRARLLRRLFVFKLIPMLNPDGVSRGHYRTDQLGVNLNRVYLDPDFERHPSIYAVKSLIVYHHVNNRTSKEHDGLNFDKIFKLEFDPDDIIENESSVGKKIEITDEPIFKKLQSTSKTKSQTFDADKQLLESSLLSTSSSSSLSLSDILSENNINKNERTISSHRKETLTHIPDLEPRTFNFHRSKSFAIPSQHEDFAKLSINRSLDMKTFTKTETNFLINNLKRNIEVAIANSNANIRIERELSRNIIEKRIGNENSDEDGSSPIQAYGTNKSIYSPHLNDTRLSQINPFWSGIAFYVDLHGHAAKRGCFIYGNSIDNELYQVENVLFAKLISFNTQHFDFDGCNFSVKNMFMKDKREGLSKEGSGRVAMFKTLGLIHSYTLECCYASGRVMNTIPPAVNNSNLVGNRFQSSGVVSPALHTDLPPKFMPEHYADVGKAIAIAALDIIEMNPHSRVPNSSFGNLEAVRNWIKFFIRSKNGGGVNQINNSIIANQILSSNTNNNPTNNQPKKSSISTNQRFLVRQSQKMTRFVNNNNSKTQEPKTSSSQPIAKVGPLVKTNTNNSNNFNKSTTNKPLNVPLKKSLTPQDLNNASKATKILSQRYSLGGNPNLDDYEELDKNDLNSIKKNHTPTAGLSYKSSNFSFFGSNSNSNNNTTTITTTSTTTSTNNNTTTTTTTTTNNNNNNSFNNNSNNEPKLSNLLQFNNQIQTQYRNNVLKIKDIDSSPAKSITPSAMNKPNSAVSSIYVNKLEDNTEFDSKWYSNLEPINQSDVAFSKSQKVKPPTRKLMPITKATVLGNNISQNQSSNTTSDSKNLSNPSQNASIVLFNKISTDLSNKNRPSGNSSKLKTNNVLFTITSDQSDGSNGNNYTVTRKRLTTSNPKALTKLKKDSKKSMSEPNFHKEAPIINEPTEIGTNTLDDIKEKSEAIIENSDNYDDQVLITNDNKNISTPNTVKKKQFNFIRKTQSVLILNELSKKENK